MTTNKPKFINKYENYVPKKGTINKMPSKTDQTFKDDVDIYACIEKYGIGTLMRKSQATEYLYEDTTLKPKTLAEALEQRKQLDDYFAQQPARVRKQFGDSPEVFYQKFKNGDFDDFIKTGVLNNEIANRYKETLNDEKQITNIQEKNTNSENIPSDTTQGDN